MTEEQIIFQEISERMIISMEHMQDNLDEMEKLILQLLKLKNQ